MRQEVDNLAFYPDQNNTFDIKKFIFRILRIWYWFVLSILIGIFGAWLYKHYMPPDTIFTRH